MKIIVPMAGTGNRFVEAGYTDPKPLIKANGKRIIEYILEAYDKDDDFIFICNEVHLETTPMREVLEEVCPNGTIVSMPVHKEGPVVTVKQVYDLIDDEEPVIISYCDNPHTWDYNDFKAFVRRENADGCVITHVGFHPHTLSDTKMAFLKETDGRVTEIKEKECYTDNPMAEHASTGAYYFRTGQMVKKYFDEALQQNLQYKGEYYVTLVYNLLIQDNLNVMCYAADCVTVFGTPEELEMFNAFATILKGTQVKEPMHLLAGYRYWEWYHLMVNTWGVR